MNVLPKLPFEFPIRDIDGLFEIDEKFNLKDKNHGMRNRNPTEIFISNIGRINYSCNYIKIGNKPELINEIELWSKFTMPSNSCMEFKFVFNNISNVSCKITDIYNRNALSNNNGWVFKFDNPVQYSDGIYLINNLASIIGFFIGEKFEWDYIYLNSNYYILHKKEGERFLMMTRYQELCDKSTATVNWMIQFAIELNDGNNYAYPIINMIEIMHDFNFFENSNCLDSNLMISMGYLEKLALYTGKELSKLGPIKFPTGIENWEFYVNNLLYPPVKPVGKKQDYVPMNKKLNAINLKLKNFKLLENTIQYIYDMRNTILHGNNHDCEWAVLIHKLPALSYIFNCILLDYMDYNGEYRIYRALSGGYKSSVPFLNIEKEIRKAEEHVVCEDYKDLKNAFEIYDVPE